MPALEHPRRLGLIVNPIAGMGGPVGLKGTDGPNACERARRLGAVPRAEERADAALSILTGIGDRLEVVAAPGPMGASLAAARGFDVRSVGGVSARPPTSAADTRHSVEQMLHGGVELILFAGGDGTARDIHASIGPTVPVIGVPTGVKMHSGVFARNPRAAGEAALSYLRRPPVEALIEDAEVVDRPAEDAEGAPRLYGTLRVPSEPSRMLGPKAPASGATAGALDAACAEIVASMEPGCPYVLGPGTTMGRLRTALGFQSSPLAVDVVKGRRPMARDVNESDLLVLLDAFPGTRVVVGVVGGQGSLFGRGNQQISARVLSRIGVDAIDIVAGLDKLVTLSPPRLNVDTGDPLVDGMLSGFRRVHVARGETVIYEVSS